jgi:tetratricopeptide (TPR) repeat protein
MSRWLTRIQAIGFGISLLLLIEVGCLLLGFGKKDPGNDPFIGFSGLEPLFGLNPVTNRFEIRGERGSFFCDTSFPRVKKPDTFRIFVFGGSTVQGRPYSIETAFPEWLRINLQLAIPGKNFEVVNCGGISYASYRLAPIVEECLSYDPDLYILCTGQNEFLEARTYGSLKKLSKPMGGVVKVVRNLATYQALNTAYIKWINPDAAHSIEKKPIMKGEVDAFLDYRRGLEAYHRDESWKEGVIAHFQENIRRIDGISRKADIPLVVLNPPVNLKDTPPFKSEHSSTLNKEQIEAYSGLLTQASGYFQTDLRKALQCLEQAVALDPEYAMTHYSMGHCYLGLLDFRKAEHSFIRALEEDVCPLRLLPSMRSFVNDYCQENHIAHIDLQPLLKEYSEEPVIGNGILIDHVHPTIRGNQVIAQTTTDLLLEKFLGKPKTNEWLSQREPAYKAHLEALPPLYYVHGNYRLESLNKWTKGQTDGPPIEMHAPIDPR